MLIDLPLNEQEIAFVTQQAKQQGVTTNEFVANMIRHQLLFYYDIEQMDKASSAPRAEIPKSAIKDLASFERWLDGAF